MVLERKQDGIFAKDRETHGVRAMREVQLKDIKIAKNLMMGLNETIDQLAISNSVHWYGHVLKREDYHVLRRAVDIEVEGQ